MEKRRLWIYMGLTFGLTWGLLGAGVLAGLTYGGTGMSLCFFACMLLPAVSSLLTRWITREGFGKMGLGFGWKQGGWHCYLAAFFGPTVLVALGGLGYFLLFPQQWDGSGAIVAMQLESLGQSPDLAQLVIWSQLFSGILLGPIINVPFTLGEELGWRAYLLPKLADLYGRRRAILFSGLIWGLWHAPMIAMGHNYGVTYWGYPVTGILTMVVFCLAAGSFEAYLTFRTNSVWPAAMTHSGINALAAAPTLFLALDAQPNPLLGPILAGLLGGWALLLVGLWCFIRCPKEAPHVPKGNL